MPLFYLLIPILGSICAFLFAMSLIPTKSPLAAQLEALQGQNLNGPDKGKLTFERVFSGERRSIIRRQLLEAGWYTVTPAQLGLRIVACGGIGLLLALSILRFVHFQFFFVVALAGITAICTTYAPLFALNSAIAARKSAIQKALPDFLDMVATTVQAGLSVNASLAYAIDAAPGPLGDEIKEALAEMRLGRARAEALKAAADRARQQAFSTMISAITQAEKLGANISKVLNEIAEDTRHQRIMLVEEQAAKLPVKMVFPMAFFMLPSLFVIIFGAVAAKLLAK